MLHTKFRGTVLEKKTFEGVTPVNRTFPLFCVLQSLTIIRHVSQIGIPETRDSQPPLVVAPLARGVAGLSGEALSAMPCCLLAGNVTK